MKASGTGALPGDDLADALIFTRSELSLPFLPDLPSRGPHATMTGRAMGVVDGLDADISVGRWRLNDGTSLDQRRARTRLQHDLDILEEHCAEHAGVFKLQIAGPLSLAATVELPRGGLVLGDRGAGRELAQALAEGVAALINGVQRRMSDAELIVQVDEPYAPAVMAGTIRTVSGYASHGPVDEPQANALLRAVTDAVARAGAHPAVHCCGANTPVGVLTGAGFDGISFDIGKPDDAWARAIDSGIYLWPQIVPLGTNDFTAALEQLTGFVYTAGFALETVHEQIVVTPSCGLESVSLHEAKTALRLGQRLADSAG